MTKTLVYNTIITSVNVRYSVFSRPENDINTNFKLLLKLFDQRCDYLFHLNILDPLINELLMMTSRMDTFNKPTIH